MRDRWSFWRWVIVGGVVFFGGGRAVWGHDFWIEPSESEASLGETIRLRLWVGDHFQGKAYRRTARHLKRFEVLGGTKSIPIGGREGADPAGEIRIEEKGLHTVVYRSHRTWLEMPAPKFEAYLREEGLEWVSSERKAKGEAEQPGREWFSRCAKLLFGGTRQGDGWKRPVGMPLEIVPLVDPGGLQPKQTMTVQIVFRGKPLKGAKVVAYHRGPTLVQKQARSDQEGKVTFSLERAGLWLIKSVWMERQPAHDKAQWESFWASLTFGIAEAEGRK